MLKSTQKLNKSGEGHQLNELPGSTSQQPNAIGRPNADPHEGGREEDPRRAAAAAAEARAQAAKSRGTKGGEIAIALSNQAADGGRVDQAIATGGQSANQKPLIVRPQFLSTVFPYYNKI
jgi:hypothetical protein